MLEAEKWIKTNEDWYPSFQPFHHGNPHDHVALLVRLYSYQDSSEWMVCVWGADDKGMEIMTTEAEAWKMFDWIDDFNSEYDLKKLGLHRA